MIMSRFQNYDLFFGTPCTLYMYQYSETISDVKGIKISPVSFKCLITYILYQSKDKLSKPKGILEIMQKIYEKTNVHRYMWIYMELLHMVYCKACIFREFRFFFKREIFITRNFSYYTYTYILCMIFVPSRKSLLGKMQTIHVREKYMLYSSLFVCVVVCLSVVAQQTSFNIGG